MDKDSGYYFITAYNCLRSFKPEIGIQGVEYP